MASSISRSGTACLSDSWWSAAIRSWPHCPSAHSVPTRWTKVGEVIVILSPTTPSEELLRTCRLLMAPGDVHEVRIPNAGRRGTISGYFDDGERLAEEVLAIDGTVPGAYLPLTPCNPALLARGANRLQHCAAVTTSDVDILRRRWLLIDFDPVRPAGISSTNREHGRAMSAACGAWDDLRGAGFPDPVVADSANGAHLLYRLDLPNDSGATDLVKGVLAGVAARCAPDEISVDQTVFNAGRITKVYGTLARKGDNLPGRPHRRSRLLEIPDCLTVLEVR